MTQPDQPRRRPGRPPRTLTPMSGANTLQAALATSGISQAVVCRITGSSGATIHGACHDQAPPPPPERMILLHNLCSPGRPKLDVRPILAQRAHMLRTVEIPAMAGPYNDRTFSAALHLQAGALLPEPERAPHLARAAMLLLDLLAREQTLPGRIERPGMTDPTAALATVIEHWKCHAMGWETGPIDADSTKLIADLVGGQLPTTEKATP